MFDAIINFLRYLNYLKTKCLKFPHQVFLNGMFHRTKKSMIEYLVINLSSMFCGFLKWKENYVKLVFQFKSVFQEILNGIVDKGPEFSELEYMNAFQLLNRSKAGKELGSVSVHLERLSDILGEVGVTVWNCTTFSL